jgi:hypothetical protein
LYQMLVCGIKYHGWASKYSRRPFNLDEVSNFNETGIPSHDIFHDQNSSIMLIACAPTEQSSELPLPDSEYTVESRASINYR